MRFLAKSFEIPTLLVLGLGLGAGAGFGVHEMLKPTLMTIEGDASAYLMDAEAAFEKYEAAKRKGTPLESALEPAEMISVAHTLFDAQEYSYCEGVGVSRAMGLVDQGIQSWKVRDKDRYFEESNSFSSFVALYNRMYQEGDSTTKYWGKTPNYGGNAPEEVSNEQYASEMGRQVSESIVYLVSPKTDSPVDLSGRGLSSIKKHDGGYTVDFEADPASSTLRYVHQMKTISNLKEFPSFDYVHLTYELDEDLNLLYFRNYESYRATLASGIGSTCEGSMTTVFRSAGPGEAAIPLPSDPSIAYPSDEAALLQKYGY